MADLPLKDCTTAVLTTLDKDMRKAEKVKYSASRDGDKELFDLVANIYKQKNGDKFIKLYRHGDYSDYGSHSEADLALCSTNPGDNTKPGETVTPGNNADGPQTGDHSSIVLAVAVLLVSGGALTVLAIAKKKAGKC